MDEELGQIKYIDTDKMEYVAFKPFSEQTAQLIDQKIKLIINDSYEKAKKIIADNKETITKLSIILLEKEYLTRQEFLSIMSEPTKIDEILVEIRAKAKEKNQKNEQEKQPEKQIQTTKTIRSRKIEPTKLPTKNT
ncbi:MAG: hypothetical protein ACOZBL_06070 [Patescibacteria group bacterium]